MVLPFALIICLSILPYLATPAQAKNPGPFFSISILAPNTSQARNQWATLMVEQLPKIGIAVDVFDHTGWAQIGPRTWSHPGPYPIPTYAEGGFDILFIGYGWGLDFDPTGLFTSDGWTPAGDNYYQYANPEMDWAVGNYTQSFVFNERMEWAKEIQEILYEDNPSLCILYKTSLYAHEPGLAGWSPLLWASSYQPMENWSLNGQTDFHYAVPADFVDFHPWLYESTYDAGWLRQIFNGIYDRDPTQSNSYQPRIAQSVTSGDGLTYNIALKPNLYWADGAPLTVDDIIYNYQLGVTASLGHTTYSFFTQYWNNDSVVKISDTECTITFLQPYVFQDGNLALDLLPKHIWESVAPIDHASQAISWATSEPSKLFGCGPYRLAAWDATNAIIHLTKNDYFDDWFGVEPNFDDVYFESYSNKEGALAALGTGLVDMLDSEFYVTVSDLSGLPGSDYDTVDNPGNQEMSINMLHPYIGTGELCPIAGTESGKHIRKAISHIIPRQIIVDEILDGLGRAGVTHWPSVSVGFDESLEPYEYSVDTALAHMAAAGFDVSITEVNGIGLAVVISILALVGASQVFFLKRRK